MTLQLWEEFKFYCKMHYIDITGQYDIVQDEIVFYNSNLKLIAADFVAKESK